MFGNLEIDNNSAEDDVIESCGNVYCEVFFTNNDVRVVYKPTLDELYRYADRMRSYPDVYKVEVSTGRDIHSPYGMVPEVVIMRGLYNF